MNLLRNPSDQERAVITALLQGKSETVHFIDTLDDLLVMQMDDGGMGGLSLVPIGLKNVIRSFGQQLVIGEFIDSDGVTVSVTINTDSRGQLYELDIWKVNFSALVAWPDPANVRIIG